MVSEHLFLVKFNMRWEGVERSMVKSGKFAEGGKSLKPIRVSVRIAFFMLVLLMVVLVLLLFEFAARWHYRDIVSTSHGWDYFMRRSIGKYNAERNSLGFRGGEFTEKKGEAYRVIVIGDSFAWGQGILPRTSRFTEQAEELFAQRYPGVPLEIINMAIPGNNLGHHYLFLSKIKNFAPDFVLYQWYVNDVDDEVDAAAFHAHRLIPNERLHSELKASSVTYLLLFRAWNQLRTVLGLQKTYTGYLVDKFRDQDSPPARWAADKLREVVTGLRRDGIAAGIVLFPQLDGGKGEYQLAFLHERVLAECMHQNIPCLDLRQAYTPFAGHMQDLWANPFDAHPGVSAHRIAAEQIVEAFGPVWKEKAARP